MRIHILLFIFSLIQGCLPYEETEIGTIFKPHRYNLIGIVGDTSSVTSIEIEYMVFDKYGKGSKRKINATPPILVGGYSTYVNHKKLTSNGALQYYEEPIIDYNQGGTHFMKIKNNSSFSLQYFIAGTHPIKMTDLEKEFNGIHETSKKPPSTLAYSEYPQVVYKNASIYYLIHPSEKPKKNQFCIDYSQYEDGTYGYSASLEINFRENLIGNLLVNSPWEIEDIMKLYSRHYKNDKEIHLSLRHLLNPQSLKTEYEKYYGIINPGDSIISSAENPLINHFQN